MRHSRFSGLIVIVFVTVLMLTTASCFGNSGNEGNSSTNPTPLLPKPSVDSYIATTSGTENAYYAILDIKVKNTGAEGTILVIASVTQNGKTNQDEMPVYLKQNEIHELKLTFPLVWKGGDWTTNVQTQVP